MSIDGSLGDVAKPDGFYDCLSELAFDLDPRFVDAYRRMWRAARRRGALSPATRELIGLAVNAAVTHLYIPAVERHISLAIEAGATELEIVEVLELSSVLGVHTITSCLPGILEVCGCDTSTPLSEEQEQLKAAFEGRRGAWADIFEQLLRFDTEFFAGYLDFSSAPWEHTGGLEPKVREFIYVAVDASTTHMLAGGSRFHAANAVRHGASFDELLEVLELTALIGMQTFVEGSAALVEAMSHRKPEVNT